MPSRLLNPGLSALSPVRAEGRWSGPLPCGNVAGLVGYHYQTFTDEFSTFDAFDHPTGGRVPSHRLFALQQGDRSIADYAFEFRILAAEVRSSTS